MGKTHIDFSATKIKCKDSASSGTLHPRPAGFTVVEE